jgi:hypothetical protein
LSKYGLTRGKLYKLYDPIKKVTLRFWQKDWQRFLNKEIPVEEVFNNELNKENYIARRDIQRETTEKNYY